MCVDACVRGGAYKAPRAQGTPSPSRYAFLVNYKNLRVCVFEVGFTPSLIHRATLSIRVTRQEGDTREPAAAATEEEGGECI